MSTQRIKKNFAIIAAGQLISLLGSAVQRFGMSLYLLDLTGSPGLFAAVLAVSMLPYVLLAPAAGKITDSFSKKKVMIGCDIFSGVVITCYAAVLFSGNDRPVIITVIMILLSCASTVYGPAVTASVPLAVPDRQLYRANGIIQQIGSAANFAGPVAAGMIYGLLGIRWIVILNGISFFASALMEGFLHLPEETGNTGKKVSLAGSVREMYEGFLYLKKSRLVVLKMIISYGLSNLFIVPVFSVAAPHYIKNVLGMSSEVYGTAEGIIVLGMITGGMLISAHPGFFSMGGIHRILYLMPAAFLFMCLSGILSEAAFLNLMAFTAGGISCYAFPWTLQCHITDLYAAGGSRNYAWKDQCIFYGSSHGSDPSRTIFVWTDLRGRSLSAGIVSFCICCEPGDSFLCESCSEKLFQKSLKKFLHFRFSFAILSLV